MRKSAERQILIVSSSEKGTEFFQHCLDGSFSVSIACSGAEGRRMLGERDYDIVVVNCPLKDEFGRELAEEAVKSPYAGVMLVVKAEIYEETAFEEEKYGIYCLQKPVSAQSFLHGLGFSVATNERLKGLMMRTENLKEKMEEIKLVGRAKLLLITKLSMSENEAHKYIEKQAMDRCEKKSQIALEIIKTYND